MLGFRRIVFCTNVLNYKERTCEDLVVSVQTED